MDYFADVLDVQMTEEEDNAPVPSPTTCLDQQTFSSLEEVDEDECAIPYGTQSTGNSEEDEETPASATREKVGPVVQRNRACAPPIQRDYGQMHQSRSGYEYGYDDDEDEGEEDQVRSAARNSRSGDHEVSPGSQLTQVELTPSLLASATLLEKALASTEPIALLVCCVATSHSWTTRKGKRATTLVFCDAKPRFSARFVSLTMFDACSEALQQAFRDIVPTEPQVLLIRGAKMFNGSLSYSDRRKACRMQWVTGGLQSLGFARSGEPHSTRSLWAMIQPQEPSLAPLREWAERPHLAGQPAPLCTFLAVVALFGAREREENAWVQLLTSNGHAVWLEVPSGTVSRLVSPPGDAILEASLEAGDCVVVVAARASRKKGCSLRLVPGESFLFVLSSDLVVKCSSSALAGDPHPHQAKLMSLSYGNLILNAKYEGGLLALATLHAQKDDLAPCACQSFYSVPDDPDMLMRCANRYMSDGLRNLADTFLDLVTTDPPLSFISNQPLKFYLDKGASSISDLARICSELVKSKDGSRYASIRSVFSGVSILHLTPSTANGSVSVRCAYPGDSLLSVTVVGKGVLSPSEYSFQCKKSARYANDDDADEAMEIPPCRNAVRQASCLDTAFVCQPYNSEPPLPDGTVLHTCSDFVVCVRLKCFFSQLDPATGEREELADCTMSAAAVETLMSLGLPEGQSFCHKSWFASSPEEQRDAIERALAMCQDIRFTLTLTSSRYIRQTELHVEPRVYHQVIFLEQEE